MTLTFGMADDYKNGNLDTIEKIKPKEVNMT